MYQKAGPAALIASVPRSVVIDPEPNPVNFQSTEPRLPIIPEVSRELSSEPPCWATSLAGPARLLARLLIDPGSIWLTAEASFWAPAPLDARPSRRVRLVGGPSFLAGLLAVLAVVTAVQDHAAAIRVVGHRVTVAHTQLRGAPVRTLPVR